MGSLGPLFKTSIGLLREMTRLIHGIWKMGYLPEPRVTVFGGSKLRLNSPVAQKAHELGHLLAHNNFSVITGGGSGIMRAITCGVTHGTPKGLPKRVMGITVQGLDESLEPEVICPQELIVTDSFFSRKVLLINYSKAFIVLPGGFGTLDELAGVATLIQTRKLPKVPVILIGKQFWAPFTAWLTETVLKNKLIHHEDLALFRVTDDLHEVIRWLNEYHDPVSRQGKESK